MYPGLLVLSVLCHLDYSAGYSCEILTGAGDRNDDDVLI